MFIFKNKNIKKLYIKIVKILKNNKQMDVFKKLIKSSIKTIFQCIAWSIFARAIMKAGWMFITEWISFKSQYSIWQDQAHDCQMNSDIATKFAFACEEAKKNLGIWPIFYAIKITFTTFPTCIEYNCEDVVYFILDKITRIQFIIPIVLIGFSILWFVLSFSYDKYQIYQFNKAVKNDKKKRKQIENEQEHVMYFDPNAAFGSVYPNRKPLSINNK
jgi:hypothetical protein